MSKFLNPESTEDINMRSTIEEIYGGKDLSDISVAERYRIQMGLAAQRHTESMIELCQSNRVSITREY